MRWTQITFAIHINNPAFREQVKRYIVEDLHRATRLSIPIAEVLEEPAKLPAIMKYARAAIIRVVDAQPTREYMEQFTMLESWRQTYAAYYPLVFNAQLVSDISAHHGLSKSWISDAVKEFQRKHNCPVDERELLTMMSGRENMWTLIRILHAISRNVKFFAQLLEVEASNLTDAAKGSPGFALQTACLRSSLMLEELGEAIEGIASGDPETTLDGLADLEYVLHGTAVVYGLPLTAAFEEVHKSNMTKAVSGETRLRSKGDGYVAPNLKALL